MTEKKQRIYDSVFFGRQNEAGSKHDNYKNGEAWTKRGPQKALTGF